MKTVSNITDKLSLCLRGAIYYARIRLDSGRYVWQSLEISENPKSNRKKAEQAALIYAGSVQNKQQNSQPIVKKAFGDVIAEYVKLRTAENAQKRTSDFMLRGILRVTKYLSEYAGTKSVAAIGNKELEEYVIWRTDYYKNRPMPKNAKQAPKDKTIQWEITLFKTILRWAHGRGYFGAKSLPTWSFKVKNRTVRPAFTWAEYNKLWRAMDKWQKDCVHSDRQYTRQLLRDYVLILANSGMRVGEANNLRLKDLKSTTDIKKRKVYEFMVYGKTGGRTVTLRAHAAKYVNRLLENHPTNQPDDYLFCMADGRKITTLADQFDKVLDLAGISQNSKGQKYCLYSLRHYYAVGAIRRDMSHNALANNMGTSVKMLENYYGRSACGAATITALAD